MQLKTRLYFLVVGSVLDITWSIKSEKYQHMQQTLFRINQIFWGMEYLEKVVVGIVMCIYGVWHRTHYMEDTDIVACVPFYYLTCREALGRHGKTTGVQK